MASAMHPTKGNIALTDSGRFSVLQRRYLGLMDVGVLLLSLLVFFVFLLLLNRILFPEGARLGRPGIAVWFGTTNNRAAR